MAQNWLGVIPALMAAEGAEWVRAAHLTIEVEERKRIQGVIQHAIASGRKLEAIG